MICILKKTDAYVHFGRTTAAVEDFISNICTLVPDQLSPYSLLVEIGNLYRGKTPSRKLLEICRQTV